jgi:hypothetical protein
MGVGDLSLPTDTCANASPNKTRNEILYGRCAFGGRSGGSN